MDELVIQYLLRYHDEARTRLAFGATPLLVRSLHLAIRRSLPEAESIIAGFNAEIILMMVDRSYHRLLHLDWISASTWTATVSASTCTTRMELGTAHRSAPTSYSRQKSGLRNIVRRGAST